MAGGNRGNQSYIMFLNSLNKATNALTRKFT